MLVKTDAHGNVEWSKSYANLYDDQVTAVRQTMDGGYIMVGYRDDDPQGAPTIYLIKTNAFGDTLWTRSYGGSYYDVARSIQQVSDGGYIIAGYTHHTGFADFNVFLMRTNSTGDTLWTKTYGGPGDEFINDVQVTKDGGFIMTGWTTSIGAGQPDFLLIKTDSFGNPSWVRSFGGIGQDFAVMVEQTSDSGYVMAGSTYSFGGNGSDVYLVKADANGNLLWSRTYGGNLADYGWSASPTEDGGFIIVGETNGMGAGGIDVYLIKTDALGDTLWTRAYGGASYDYGLSVIETTYGGYIVCGGSNSFGSNTYMYLIKTDADGNSGCNEFNTQTIVTDPPTIVGSGNFSIGSGFTMDNAVTTVSEPIIEELTLCFDCKDPVALFGIADSVSLTYFSDSSTNATGWTWSFGDGDSSQLQNPTHEYVTTGLYDVCLITTNECGSDTICSSYNVIIGFQEQVNNAGLTLYPNPTEGYINVRLSLPQTGNAILNIYDLNSQLLTTKHLNVGVNDPVFQLDLTSFAKGMYFLQIHTDSEIFTQKIAVQ